MKVRFERMSDIGIRTARVAVALAESLGLQEWQTCVLRDEIRRHEHARRRARRRAKAVARSRRNNDAMRRAGVTR